MIAFYNHLQITTSFKYCEDDSSRIVFEPLTFLDDLDKETDKAGIKVHSCYMAVLRNLLSCFGVAFGTTALVTDSGTIYLNNGSLRRFFKRHEGYITGLNQLKTVEKIEKIVLHFTQRQKNGEMIVTLSKETELNPSYLNNNSTKNNELDYLFSISKNIFSQRELGCDRLKKRIDFLNEWTQQIRDFVSEYEELLQRFNKTFLEEGHHVISTYIPYLEGDMNDPEHQAYLLDCQLDMCKLQFNELIRFIVTNEDLWNCFIAHLQKSENNNMNKLFDHIFTLLRKNIETESYEELRSLLADELEHLKSQKPYDLHLIRIVLLKLTSTFYEKNFFTDELLNSVEK